MFDRGKTMTIILRGYICFVYLHVFQILITSDFALLTLLNFKHLLKRPKLLGQIQIRLLLKKQSDQVFPICYSDKHFMNSISANQPEKESVQILE